MSLSHTELTWDGASDVVHCAGDDPRFGHPKIFLKLDPNTGGALCPYCGKHLEKENSPAREGL